jgi:multimeric flavodoxin WrbA
MKDDKSRKNKVVGIVGSPRKKGNTDLIIDEILKGAESNNLETERIFLNDLTINPCEGCNACFKNKNGNCKFDDDFTIVKQKMEESSTWIIGTPVYWWGPTAILKAFIDRWYQHNVTRQFFEEKNLILVVTSGGGSESYSRHVVGMIEDIAEYVGIRLRDKIICTGVGKKGAVKNRPEVLKKSFNVGKDLVLN